MNKNKFVKYKVFGKPYFWTSTIASILAVFISFIWTLNYYPFSIASNSESKKTWIIIYSVIIALSAFVAFYAFVVLILINSFVVKIEKMYDPRSEAEYEKIQKNIEKQSKILDIISLNKHISYDIYLVSKE
ncbi:hypothetical protein MCAL160_0906 [Mycoplasmopsis californica HAZ160_1]|uniref:Uncharacterized protein n=2 Tax=Mycoplasmopsis californica TaxID=2113 RepID=A0A059XVN7_9BACT|nr:hypothetical protein [Mycoplasmopsis californica]AIA29277.1 hypothetical protein MCFN_00525 [Mycoplasmopsis californica]BAP01260.1 hypothetical protein MCAL160_0906 [Mycoplasmopsis californica HAZ160_1]BBG41133.1 hypothetical protein MCAL106_0906 [Mycoplasmopsis californica]BBG41726.1 hypothetical protein MCAL106E_0906 [Mycoplasmopsis californica]BBG42320.1 hypothetical protein MCAL106L_0906 [Mycoplasmopsis californica]